MKFKKIATVLGSALMVGSTLGLAAAAAYPAPFVSNGVANVAIVVGSAGAEASDMVAATGISADLAKDLSAQSVGGVKTVTGGDSVKIEGSSNKFNLGNQANQVLTTSINSDKMPILLADGTYTDQDNTEYKYTQKIALSNNIKLNHFSDSNYKDKVPTIGVNLTNDATVLNYTLDFDTNPLFNASTMETTTLTMMGKEYYVLDVQNGSSTTNKITLLDSANSAVIAEGDSTTLTVAGKTYEVAISFIDSSKVKLTVNGQTTNSLASGATYKLSDGAYVGIKDVLYNSKDSGISKVELSIGKGKLEIQNGEVQLNDVTVNGVKGVIDLDGSAKLNDLKLVWAVDGEGYITTDSSLTLPGFESVKISMADFVAGKQELTTVKNSGSNVVELRTTIKDGDVTIPIVSTNGTVFNTIGKDSNNKLAVGNGTVVPFNYTAGDRFIVASWNSSTEAETYYLKVKVVQEDNVNKTEFTNVLDSNDQKTVSAGNDVSFGNVVITPSAIDYNGKTANLTAGTDVVFNTIYTKDGMKIAIPSINASALANTSVLQLYEADKDNNLAKINFNLTLGLNSDSKVQVKAVGGVDSGLEIGDSENYESYVINDLATKVVMHTSDDQDYAEVTYAGEQSYADVFVTSPQASVSTVGGAELGQVTVLDNEADKMTGKNLIVVGGNCVNSVAASLLGLSAGASCMADFSASTGVANGGYLIQSFDKAGKVALLVAGYSALDTTKAETYLVNNNIETSVGTKLKGTSATEATVVTA